MKTQQEKAKKNRDKYEAGASLMIIYLPQIQPDPGIGFLTPVECWAFIFLQMCFCKRCIFGIHILVHLKRADKGLHHCSLTRESSSLAAALSSAVAEFV